MILQTVSFFVNASLNVYILNFHGSYILDIDKRKLKTIYNIYVVTAQ